MTSPALRTLASASFACLALIGLGACNPRTVSGEPIHCEILLDAPSSSNGTITTQVRYWCDDPGPAHLNLRLALQKQTSATSNTWVEVRHTSISASGANTLRTDTERYRSGTLSATCVNGTYRTVVTGTSTGNSHTTSYDQVGSDHQITC
jgi:hypothetical protein